jgi:hypothetical protein
VRRSSLTPPSVSPPFEKRIRKSAALASGRCCR